LFTFNARIPLADHWPKRRIGGTYPVSRVAMMQSGQDWYGDDSPRSLDGPPLQPLDLYTALSQRLRKTSFVTLWNGETGDEPAGTQHMQG
jgi:hypothetical protein